MNARFLLSGAFAACILSLAPSAHAAYAQLAPPSGFSMQGAQAMYQAANAEKWLASTVRTNAALNVGGRAVQVPVAMRLAANAPRFLAAAVVPSFPVGLAVAGLTVAALLAEPAFREWMGQTNDFAVGADGVGRWRGLDAGDVGYSNDYSQCASSSAGHTIRCGLALQHSVPESDLTDCRIDVPGPSSVVGSCVYVGNGVRLSQGAQVKQGAQVWSPKTEEEMLERLAGRPIPDRLADKLPMPLPVEVPVLNPSPGANPVPQPLTIPLGDPVPVPNTDPQQWSQPVARVTPSPTPSNPWRVDVREEEVVSNSPDPLPDPEPSPDSPEAPKEDYNASDTPLPPVPDFYEQKYPDGFAGVWATRKAELEGSVLSQMAATLMPTQIGSGSCPQITIPLNVGLRDFGVQDISVPCSVWTFGKWVIIISALLLCRRLVFGG